MKQKSKTRPTTKSSLKKREAIIDVAATLFAEKGYIGTTLNDIAGEFGLTKAALYHYINGKDDLITEITKRNLLRMDKAIAVGETEMPSKEKMRALIGLFIQFSTESSAEANIVFEQVNALPKKIRQIVQSRKKKLEKMVQDILVEGVNDRSFIIDNTKMACFGILGFCNWTYHWYKPNHELTKEQITEAFTNILENGYLRKRD